MSSTNEQRFKVLEEELVNMDDAIQEVQFRVDKISPPAKAPVEVAEIPANYDPEVVDAKKEIAKMEAANRWDERSLSRYNKLKRLVNLDMLSRCVFEIGGAKYQLTVPALFLFDKKYTAAELMQDPRILKHLVETGAGSVKQLF